MMLSQESVSQLLTDQSFYFLLFILRIHLTQINSKKKRPNSLDAFILFYFLLFLHSNISSKRHTTPYFDGYIRYILDPTIQRIVSLALYVFSILSYDCKYITNSYISKFYNSTTSPSNGIRKSSAFKLDFNTDLFKQALLTVQ